MEGLPGGGVGLSVGGGLGPPGGRCVLMVCAHLVPAPGLARGRRSVTCAVVPSTLASESSARSPAVQRGSSFWGWNEGPHTVELGVVSALPTGFSLGCEVAGLEGLGGSQALSL